MNLRKRRERRTIVVELPQALATDLPEELALMVPEGVAESIASAVSDATAAAATVPETLRSIEVLRDLPERIAGRLRALRRGIRLPILSAEAGVSALEGLLHSRERELSGLRAQSSRNLVIGTAVGTVAGVAVVFALLPDRQERFAEIRARLRGIDAPAEYLEDARRLAVRAREAVAERVRLAREEARQVREATERDLWTRVEVAKRDGHVPRSQ